FRSAAEESAVPVQRKQSHSPPTEQRPHASARCTRNRPIFQPSTHKEIHYCSTWPDSPSPAAPPGSAPNEYSPSCPEAATKESSTPLRHPASRYRSLSG